MKILFSKKFLKLFLISFLIYLALLLIHLLSRYAPDIFLKNNSVERILRFVFFSAITLSAISLFFGFFNTVVR